MGRILRLEQKSFAEKSAVAKALKTNASRDLEIVYHRLSELKSDPKNPRRHSPKQIKQLERSIRTFGFAAPVLIDRFSNIIAGHARCQAAERAGLDQVPTVMLEHLTPAQVTALRIADNRLCEVAVWDEPLLAENFQTITELNIDFDMEVTGFSVGEIDAVIERVSDSEERAEDPDDRLRAAGPPVSRPGDLWVLGRHRVLCGNSQSSEALKKLMNGGRAAMVFADPPYNVKIPGHASGKGARHRDFKMASGEMTQAEFIAFLSQALALLVLHSADGSLHFICMDWRHQAELLKAGEEAYTELKNLCIWVKNSAGMGSLYRSQHELIFVYKKGKGHHKNNIQLGRFGRDRSNVWRYPDARTFSRSGEEGNLLALHPTVKPVALVQDAILDASARGDIVLDPFLGSGTTLIAAERTGRRCFGLELDPLYVDVIVRRWQAHTGESARHLESGKTFDAIVGRKGKNDVAA